jgi:hypothetical protein
MRVHPIGEESRDTHRQQGAGLIGCAALSQTVAVAARIVTRDGGRYRT